MRQSHTFSSAQAFNRLPEAHNTKHYDDVTNQDNRRPPLDRTIDEAKSQI
jgi:hypothetical protein